MAMLNNQRVTINVKVPYFHTTPCVNHVEDAKFVHISLFWCVLDSEGGCAYLCRKICVFYFFSGCVDQGPSK